MPALNLSWEFFFPNSRVKFSITNKQNSSYLAANMNQHLCSKGANDIPTPWRQTSEWFQPYLISLVMLTSSLYIKWPFMKYLYLNAHYFKCFLKVDTSKPNFQIHGNRAARKIQLRYILKPIHSLSTAALPGEKWISVREGESVDQPHVSFPLPYPEVRHTSFPPWKY